MKDLLKNTFNNEAEIYDLTTQYLLLNYDFFLRQAVEKISKPFDASFTILDLGCGTGNLIKLIRETYPNAVIYALDYSTPMIDKAVEKEIKDVKFIQCDMFDIASEHLPLFDVIISSYVFHNFTSINDHRLIFNLINEHLAVKGKLILLDLIDLADVEKEKNYESSLTASMREHGLKDEEIIKWMGILKVEDAPLTVDLTTSILSENNFESITINLYEKCGCAIFVADKITDVVLLKSELLFLGLRENDIVKQIYLIQNPNDIWKTGNNGVFLSVMGLDALLSINHKANKESPYEIVKQGINYALMKNHVVVTTDISILPIPEWYYTPVGDFDFSKYFVFEGRHFLHLAYKGCAFSLKDKCKFCSTKRRTSGTDNSPDKIVTAFKLAHKKMSADIQICLGGGTYIPFSENVQYFFEIIQGIRSIDSKIPVWVECIPPTIEEIDKLIDAGATAFGFNIEIWNQELRERICPGKSQVSLDEYLNAMKHVINRLGPNRVGSCIIVGLDSYDSVVDAIDALTDIGVEPCILPYKKYNRTNLGAYEIPEGYQHDFINLSYYAAKKAYEKNVIFDDNQGCLSCACCTIMHDIQSKIKKGEIL
ncbi:MAG: methyltransferase domain-containing protein [Clostridia bacterium]|nr:methyltransferase domain-containing protein [Clostridia bacterium]